MQPRIKSNLQSGISFFLGLIFTAAGIEKLTGLPDIIGPHYLIEELAKYDLGLYGQFIAFSQMIIGFLLLTNRFRVLGAIMLFPMLCNILMITISLNWNGTPYIVTFLLLLNLLLLLLDYHKLKFILSDSPYSELSRVKLTRKNLTLDVYYLIPLGLILSSAYFGWTDMGKMLARVGFFLALLSMLTLNIYNFSQRKKVNQTKESDS
jgi:uncharacterized membrane protein YphA (DoxX/SURF4 family)